MTLHTVLARDLARSNAARIAFGKTIFLTFLFLAWISYVQR